MPGVVGTDLQVEDNAEMVKDNIKITGVDPGEMEDYPKLISTLTYHQANQ
jgi:hypothetical protein